MFPKHLNCILSLHARSWIMQSIFFYLSYYLSKEQLYDYCNSTNNGEHICYILMIEERLLWPGGIFPFWILQHTFISTVTKYFIVGIYCCYSAWQPKLNTKFGVKTTHPPQPLPPPPPPQSSDWLKVERCRKTLHG